MSGRTMATTAMSKSSSYDEVSVLQHTSDDERSVYPGAHAWQACEGTLELHAVQCVNSGSNSHRHTLTRPPSSPGSPGSADGSDGSANGSGSRGGGVLEHTPSPLVVSNHQKQHPPPGAPHPVAFRHGAPHAHRVSTPHDTSPSEDVYVRQSSNSIGMSLIVHTTAEPHNCSRQRQMSSETRREGKDEDD